LLVKLKINLIEILDCNQTKDLGNELGYGIARKLTDWLTSGSHKISIAIWWTCGAGDAGGGGGGVKFLTGTFLWNERRINQRRQLKCCIMTKPLHLTRKNALRVRWWRRQMLRWLGDSVQCLPWLI